MNSLNQKAIFFYIQGQVVNENDPTKPIVTAFWTKTGWSMSVDDAKKYRSEKVAKNSISKISNTIFQKATDIKVKEIFPPQKVEKPKSNSPNVVHISSDYCDGSYTPDGLEFDEDGECEGDSTWDYPGSPYLSDDNDIY